MENDWTPARRVSDEEIAAAMSARGGWTYAQLKEWGVPTPPPKGWRKRLTTFGDEPALDGANAALDRMMASATTRMVDGGPFGVSGELDIDPAKLLRKVVVAVINAGHASCLYDFPDVLAYFGARRPAQE